MDFSCSEEQEAVAELARQIMADKATKERLMELEKGAGPRFDRELWEEIAKAGILGIGVPEEHGGAGLGFFELSLIIEQLGVTVAPIPFIETAILAALPIAEFGTDAQQAAWLPRVVEGSVVLTAALTENLRETGNPGTQAATDGSGSKRCGACWTTVFSSVFASTWNSVVGRRKLL